MNLLRDRFRSPAPLEKTTGEAELRDAQLALQATSDHNERKRLARHIRQKFFSQPAWHDIDAPLESSQPIIVCIAYPRSGLTFSISTVGRMIGGAHRFTALPHSIEPFDKRWYPKGYPKPRVIKDHRADPCYRPDTCVMIVRDGRDCMASLAWMTLADKRHAFKERHEMADFIRWIDSSYPFGSWGPHSMAVLDLAGHDSEKKTLLRYESFRDAVHIPADNGHLDGHAALEQTSTELGMNAETRTLWGLGINLPPNSMFEAWQANRGGSNWRQTFNRAAAKAFHETGATEPLIRLGYETDEAWWRQC